VYHHKLLPAVVTQATTPVLSTPTTIPTTTTLGVKEIQELKAKKNLSLSTLNDR
jgi:hypothetical protein